MIIMKVCGSQIEMSTLNNFSGKRDILWKTYAPDSILNKLTSSQLAESLQTWYINRENLSKTEFNAVFSSIGSCQCIWFNRNIRSKSKQYFLYQDWLDRGIVYISDLLNPPHPGNKLFEELILDYGISAQDRRIYNFLFKSIPKDWLVTSDLTPDTIFDEIRTKLLKTQKTPKYAYSVMLESCVSENIDFVSNIPCLPHVLPLDLPHVYQLSFHVIAIKPIIVNCCIIPLKVTVISKIYL